MMRKRRAGEQEQEGGAIHRCRFCVSASVWFPTVSHLTGRSLPHFHLPERLRLGYCS